MNVDYLLEAKDIFDNGIIEKFDSTIIFKFHYEEKSYTLTIDKRGRVYLIRYKEDNDLKIDKKTSGILGHLIPRIIRGIEKIQVRDLILYCSKGDSVIDSYVFSLKELEYDFFNLYLDIKNTDEFEYLIASSWYSDINLTELTEIMENL